MLAMLSDTRAPAVVKFFADSPKPTVGYATMYQLLVSCTHAGRGPPDTIWCLNTPPHNVLMETLPWDIETPPLTRMTVLDPNTCTVHEKMDPSRIATSGTFSISSTECGTVWRYVDFKLHGCTTDVPGVSGPGFTAFFKQGLPFRAPERGHGPDDGRGEDGGEEGMAATGPVLCITKPTRVRVGPDVVWDVTWGMVWMQNGMLHSPSSDMPAVVLKHEPSGAHVQVWFHHGVITREEALPAVILVGSMPRVGGGGGVGGVGISSSGHVPVTIPLGPLVWKLFGPTHPGLALTHTRAGFELPNFLEDPSQLDTCTMCVHDGLLDCWSQDRPSLELTTKSGVHVRAWHRNGILTPSLKVVTPDVNLGLCMTPGGVLAGPEAVDFRSPEVIIKTDFTDGFIGLNMKIQVDPTVCPDLADGTARLVAGKLHSERQPYVTGLFSGLYLAYNGVLCPDLGLLPRNPFAVQECLRSGRYLQGPVLLRALNGVLQYSTSLPPNKPMPAIMHNATMTKAWMRDGKLVTMGTEPAYESCARRVWVNAKGAIEKEEILQTLPAEVDGAGAGVGTGTGTETGCMKPARARTLRDEANLWAMVARMSGL